MNPTCTNCGKTMIPPEAKFCASCGHPAGATQDEVGGRSLPVAAVAQKVAPAPKSGGVKGVMVTVGALGCLGALVIGVIALVFMFYAVGNSSKRTTTTPSAPQPQSQPQTQRPAQSQPQSAPQNSGPLYTKSLESLVPKTLGSLVFQRFERLDADTIRMLGASDAVKAIYQPKMNLLVLNYRSIDGAGSAIDPLRSALFPDKDGWSATVPAAAASGIRVHATRSQEAATLWNWGSLLVIMWGPPAQVQEFEARYIK